MKKRLKKTLALLLAAATATALLCGNAWAASGKCGANLKWSLSGSTLTVSGTGAMYNYSSERDAGHAPWAPYLSQIRKIVVKKGVTVIGTDAFTPDADHDFSGTCTVSLPAGLKRIRKAAFFDGKLRTVTIPASVTVIEDIAFAGNPLRKVTFQKGSKLTAIGEEGLSGLDLQKLVLPAGVKKVGYNIMYCYGTERIYFTGNAPEFHSYGFEFSKPIIYYPAGNRTWAKTVKKTYSAEKITWRKWNPYRTSLTRVAPGRKKAVVRWKRNAKATGYQVQYATNKKFGRAKLRTVKGAKKTAVTLKKLAGKRKYYFRVRTYKVDAGRKYVSAWSGAKAATIKK